MKEIPLTRGYVALVDDADFERVSQHKWHAQTHYRGNKVSRVYVLRHVRRADGTWTTQLLHRFILEAESGLDVDHIDGNGLNNTRGNIRVCTHSENLRNQKPRSGCSSLFKGVGWNRRGEMWQAYITVNGKMTHLGLFADEHEAAQAYDVAARERFGVFARVNF